jgi:hypothetical protein
MPVFEFLIEICVFGGNFGLRDLHYLLLGKFAGANYDAVPAFQPCNRNYRCRRPQYKRQ